MEELEQYLSAQGSAGSVESQGAFTLSWSSALDKIRAAGSSKKERYLLSLVAAGIGWGANRVEVQSREDKLTLKFRGVETLSPEIEKTLRGESVSMDFVRGLLGSTEFGTSGFQVRVGEQLWKWSGREFELSHGADKVESLAFESLRPSPELMDSLRSFFQTLRGVVSLPDDCRLLALVGLHSPVPISINGQSIRATFFLPESPLAVVVGSPPQSLLSTVSEVWKKLDCEGWSGGLALSQDGSIAPIVNGIKLEPFPFPCLSGIVWAPWLTTDLGMEKVAQDQGFARLIEELKSCRVEMLMEAASRLDMHYWVREALARDFGGGLLNREQMARYLEFSYGRQGMADDKIELIEQALKTLISASPELRRWLCWRRYELGRRELRYGTVLTTQLFADFFLYSKDLERFLHPEELRESLETLRADLKLLDKWQYHRENRETLPPEVTRLLILDLSRASELEELTPEDAESFLSWLWHLSNEVAKMSRESARYFLEEFWDSHPEKCHVVADRAYRCLRFCFEKAGPKVLHLAEDVRYFLVHTTLVNPSEVERREQELLFWRAQPVWVDLRDALDPVLVLRQS